MKKISVNEIMPVMRKTNFAGLALTRTVILAPLRLMFLRVSEQGNFSKIVLDVYASIRHYLLYIFMRLPMVKSKDKRERLRASGTFNRSADKVKDPLFISSDFFDPEDLAQVKYEMVRRVTHDKMPVAKAAGQFGFSRPSFYAAKDALDQSGMTGLISKKTGPQHGYKLTDDVLDYVWKQLNEDGSLNTKALLELVQSKFGIKVHPRTIERAIARKKNSKNNH